MTNTRSWIPLAKKTFKILLITIGSILLLLFLIPFVIPASIGERIKRLGNESINGKMDFTKARFSFFRHFPSLTLTLTDFKLLGSAPFPKDTLVYTEDFSLGINLWKLVQNKIQVSEIFLSDAQIRILVDKEGRANYNVYKESPPTKTPNADTSSASFKIEKIEITNCRLVYDDKSTGLLIQSNGLSYTGNGDLSKAIISLQTRLKADRFDLYYDTEPYILSKKIDAELLTTINTNSLALRFQKNKILINKLPVHLTGSFDFLDQGYEMNFDLFSQNARLHDVFTAFPPQYQQWLKETTVHGFIGFRVILKGKYIPGKSSPDLDLNAILRQGYIRHGKAPAPVEDLSFKLKLRIPQLETEQLHLKVDSFLFKLNNQTCSGNLETRGIENPYIKTDLHGNLDLHLLDSALALAPVQLKGICAVDLKMDGQFRRATIYKNWRPVSVVTSIPSFQLSSTVKNGEFRYTSLPEAVRDISFELQASCADSLLDHSVIKLSNFVAKAVGSSVTATIHWNENNSRELNGELHSKINVGELSRVFPMAGSSYKGTLTADFKSAGKFDPDRKVYPKMKSRLVFKEGQIQTSYYPKPITDINIESTILNATGKYNDLVLELKPVQFNFEGEPFIAEVKLAEPDNLTYDIHSKGTLDLGKIYQVFALEGMNVDGRIRTDITLKGNQGDFLAGRYHKIDNKGTLSLHQVSVANNYFPLPFRITKGDINLNREKAYIKDLHSEYGKTSLTVNGFIIGLPEYLLAEGNKLKGDLRFSSPLIFLDEFRFYSAPDTTESIAEASVILIPPTLDLLLRAEIQSLAYNGVELKNYRGNTVVKNGILRMEDNKFYLVGAPMEIDGEYAGEDPYHARFGLHFKADSFDINKAYNEIQLFRDMMPAAANASGIIGLDYELNGKLDSTMYPVMPSLRGKGELSIRKVKLKGYKLMNSLSRSTNKKELSDPDLSKITIKSSISNNILSIERTKMKVAGFRPRFEGQVSLDGKFNLKGRVGLPPFGIIGIPFHVGGTQDNPQVKLRKERESDKLTPQEIAEEQRED